ncbi:hypothetical protein NYA30BAC_02292 [Halomonas sp. NYA30]
MESPVKTGRFTPPFMAHSDILNNNATSYKEVQDYDYIVIDSMAYQHILVTKICHLENFDKFAKLNTDGSIRLVSAKYFIINNDDKKKLSAIKQLNLKASFYFFRQKVQYQVRKLEGKQFSSLLQNKAISLSRLMSYGLAHLTFVHFIQML